MSRRRAAAPVAGGVTHFPGLVPLLRERVTFGPGPKSHQKGRLETLFLRTSCAPFAGAYRCLFPRDCGSWAVVASKSYDICVLDPLPLPGNHANAPAPVAGRTRRSAPTTFLPDLLHRQRIPPGGKLSPQATDEGTGLCPPLRGRRRRFLRRGRRPRRPAVIPPRNDRKNPYRFCHCEPRSGAAIRILSVGGGDSDILRVRLF